MSRRDQIDPESNVPLTALLEAVPGGFNAIADIVERRQFVQQLLDSMAVPENPDVTWEDRTIAGPDGAPDVRVRVYHPKQPAASRPGILYIHGGGMILGTVEGEHPRASAICAEIGAVLVSVDYRLAPEDPHPAQSEDCYAALTWMAANADELGFDPSRLAVYGGSAGGGLTIATALLARDRGGPKIAFMMPIYPMIDDRNETSSSQEITDVGIWDRSGNLEAWGWYLGGNEPDHYAAPTRATDLSGLPPAYIDVGTVDLFLDEDIDFVQRLIAAGVPCEFHINPGSYHASETFAPDADLSKRIVAMRMAALKRALH